ASAALTTVLPVQAAPCVNNAIEVNVSCTQGTNWTNTSGTLINNATIDGTGSNFNGFTTGVGISTPGNITQLINNGTITDAYVGVWASSGTITKLVNNGTITSASGWAIAANLNIGTIVNNGTLYGTIGAYNSGKTTIIGATTGFGTITGGASNAQLLNSGYDIEFPSGNTILDSNVNVTGHNLVNSGASLKLIRNRTVTGNYLETGGSLIMSASSPSSFPKLTVLGNANLSGGNIVLLPVSGQDVTSYTIVSATGALNSTVAATASGYTVTSAVNGNNLILTLAEIAPAVAPPVTVDIGTLTPAPVISTPEAPAVPPAPVIAAKPAWTVKANAAGGTAVPIGPVLDALAGNNDYKLVLDVLSAMQGTPQNQALQQLSGPTPLSQALAGGASYTLTGNALAQRQLILVSGRSMGKAAGSAADGQGVWGQILGNKAAQNSSAQAGGFHSSGYGVIVGSDKRINNDFGVGAALSWLHNDLVGEGANNGSDVKLDSYQAAVYGTWRARGGPAYLSSIVSVGRNSYEQVRSVDFLGNANASYRGWQGQVKLETGYDLLLGDGFTLTPLAGLQAARISNDGYGESGLSVANLTVQRQSFNNLDSELGARLSTATLTSWGRLSGDWQTGWLRSWKNDAIATTASLGGVAFVSSTQRLRKDGAHLLLRATLQRSDNLSYSVSYEGDLRSQFRSQTATLKMRYDF
ncbi:MAG: autotransporter domain-containing protein, partial [Janthinobacterium lividum]